MLLPEKHVKNSESILGVGFVVLKALTKPMHLEMLWQLLLKRHGEDLQFSFDSVLLAIDFLYATELIAIDDEGRIIPNALN